MIFYDLKSNHNLKQEYSSQRNTTLYKLYKNHKQNMVSFVSFKFWEDCLKTMEISTSKEVKTTYVQIFGQKLGLKENILLKNIQLSDRSELSIAVCFRNKELKDQMKVDKSNEETSVRAEMQDVNITLTTRCC